MRRLRACNSSEAVAIGMLKWKIYFSAALLLLISHQSGFITLWSLLYSRTAPNMSPTTRCLVGKVRHLVPPMKESFHKGMCAAPVNASL